MAARRHPTDAVDALDRRVDLNEVGSRATAALTRWVLGTGLLWLHALAFVVVGLGLLLRNILTDPAHITVGEPLLRWGVVLAAHAAAVAIGWTVWRVAHPPPRRPVYRQIPRAAIRAGRPAPLAAEPVWYPNASANGHANGHNGHWNGHADGAPPNGAARASHLPHPAGAWPSPPRTVVTSRPVTTLVVATARDGLASARRRYRRDNRPPAQHASGTHPQQPWAGGPPAQQPSGGHAPSPWAGGAPAQPDGALPPTNGSGPAHAPDEQPATSWSAAYSRDEVISVTQVDAGSAQGLGEPPTGEADGTDPVRSWLDGYLDGQDRERESRWTWVEAAASTWLARGEDPQHALPASAPDESPTPARHEDRPLDTTPADPPASPRGGDRAFNAPLAKPSPPARGDGRPRDAAQDLATTDDPSRPQPAPYGHGASPG